MDIKVQEKMLQRRVGRDEGTVSDLHGDGSKLEVYRARRRWYKARTDVRKPSTIYLQARQQDVEINFLPNVDNPLYNSVPSEDGKVLSHNKETDARHFHEQYRSRRHWYKQRIQNQPEIIADEGFAPLLLLLFVTVCGMCPWFAASAVLPTLQSMWGIDDKQASFLTIATNCGFLCGALVSVLLRLADYYRPSNMITCGSLLAAVLNLCLVIPGIGFGGAIGFRFLTGGAMAFVYPMACKVCASWYVRHRGKAIGVVIGAVVLGSACPHLINGSFSLPWKSLVVAISLICLAAASVSFCALHEGPYYVPETKRLTRPMVNNEERKSPSLFKNRAFVLAVCAYSGHNWELYALWTWFSSFAVDTGVGSALSIAGDAKRGGSLAAFFVISAGFIGSAIAGIFADKFGRTSICLVSLALSVLFSSLTALSDGPVANTLTFGILWGLVSVAESAQYSAMVTEVVIPSRIGEASTLQFAIGYVFTIPTMYIVPYIKEMAGWQWAWLSLSVGPMISFFAVYLLRQDPIVLRAKQSLRRKQF